MTDVGLYAALETSILTALRTPAIPGVVTLEGALSVADLAADAVRKPAIGIVDAGSTFQESVAIARRGQIARFNFEVGVVVSSARGKIAARGTLRTILETVRDRIHFLSIAQPGPGRWLWKSDTPVDVTGDDLLAAVASFQLDTMIGR